MWFIDWFKAWNEKRRFRQALEGMSLEEVLTPPENRPEWWDKLVVIEVVANRRTTLEELVSLAVTDLPCAPPAIGLLMSILTHDRPYVEHPRDRRGITTSWEAYRSEALVDLVIALGYDSVAARSVLDYAETHLSHYQLERLYADLAKQFMSRLPLSLAELAFIVYDYDPRDDDSNPWE